MKRVFERIAMLILAVAWTIIFAVMFIAWVENPAEQPLGEKGYLVQFVDNLT